jgi:nucleoid-associated protein YgaU
MMWRFFELPLFSVGLTGAVLVTSGCGKAKPDNTGPIMPGPYVVQNESDDLSRIALRAYGDMDLWYTLLNANPHLAKRPGFDLELGETIQVPERANLDKSLPKSIFPKQLPADYIVMPGDSLHFIAQNCYGDRELWPRIYEANRHVLSERVKEDTRRLIAGQVLHIPARDSQPTAARPGGPAATGGK